MDLDETWQVRLRPEKTKPCTFPAKSCYGFRTDREKWVAEAFFCHVSHASLLPLSLNRFPPNFPRTRVQVLAGDIQFHIPEKFPLRDRICRKPLFLGYPICDQATGHGKRSATPTLFPSPSGHPTDVSYLGDFCWVMYRFPAIHIRKSPFATVSAIGIVVVVVVTFDKGRRYLFTQGSKWGKTSTGITLSLPFPSSTFSLHPFLSLPLPFPLLFSPPLHSLPLRSRPLKSS